MEMACYIHSSRKACFVSLAFLIAAGHLGWAGLPRSLAAVRGRWASAAVGEMGERGCQEGGHARRGLPCAHGTRACVLRSLGVADTLRNATDGLTQVCIRLARE